MGTRVYSSNGIAQYSIDMYWIEYNTRARVRTRVPINTTYQYWY